MEIDLIEKLHELVRESKLDEAINVAEVELVKLPVTDFHKIIGRTLLHLPGALTSFIDKFCREAKKETEVKAIYAEMNGFTINYGLWFINLFAFNQCGGLDDLDWLSDFETASDKVMVISGFEDLQAVYKDYMENEKWEDSELAKACEICEHLIILRLQQLFREAKKLAILKNLRWKNMPVFATAHDYDMVYMA